MPGMHHRNDRRMADHMNTENVIAEYAAVCARSHHEWYSTGKFQQIECRMCGLIADATEKEAWE